MADGDEEGGEDACAHEQNDGEQGEAVAVELGVEHPDTAEPHGGGQRPADGAVERVVGFRATRLMEGVESGEGEDDHPDGEGVAGGGGGGGGVRRHTAHRAAEAGERVEGACEELQGREDEGGELAGFHQVRIFSFGECSFVLMIL